MNFETILLESDVQDTAVRIVTLNRPEILNAMNTRMFYELRDVFRTLQEDPSVRCVLITGQGERAFCVGGDLKERNNMTDEVWRRQHELIEDTFLTVRNFPLPVIAAVEGLAMGGGFELALMCDFIIASETAAFAVPETRLGIMPGGGGVQNLARILGARRAKQYLFTGDRISAEQAGEWNIVNEITPKGEALSRTLELARRIASSAPMAMRYTKLAVSRGVDVDFDTGYALDIASYNVLVSSGDRLEGVAAFNEKRPPRWKNQ